MRPPLVVILCSLVLAACARGPAPDGRCAPTAPRRLLVEGRLTVGTDLTNPPFSMEGADGPGGFDVAVLTEASKRIGLEVRFVRHAYPGLVVGVRAQRFDLVASGFELAAQPDGQACATVPYLDGALGVVARPGTTIEGLDGRPVAVTAETPAATWSRANLESSDVSAMATTTDPFDALRRGEVDAAVAALPVALYHSKRLDGFEVVAEDGPVAEYVFLADLGNGLVAAIDDALTVMREDGTYARIYRDWFGRDPA